MVMGEEREEERERKKENRDKRERKLLGTRTGK